MRTRVGLYSILGGFAVVFSVLLLHDSILLRAMSGHKNPADGGVAYQEVAAQTGIVFQRTPSATQALADASNQSSPFPIMAFALRPIKARGAPGVAIFDYDGDGDLDIYVTNGPGSDNSLFSSRLVDSGTLTFVDVAAAAGVGATAQDSTGVCYGDIDNDGDPDLLVLGRSEPNRLFENQGDGTFADITASSGLGGGNLSSTSCSLGDVNGDGLLDIVVANNFDMSVGLAIFAEPFLFNEPNQLFLNQGGNLFSDVSDSSGIRQLAGVPPGTHDITWAIAMVDYDQDGDIDIVSASDNGAIPFAVDGGVDRGFVRIFENDGSGHFTDVSDEAAMLQPGDWMGLAFADLNSDGTLDIFATNTGDYMEQLLQVPGVTLGAQATRWFTQNPDGTFSDPGVGNTLKASAFGWGTAAIDYDNDGDTDLAYVGGLDPGPLAEASNPGIVLRNDGRADFQFDFEALGNGAVHTRRNDHGMAVGDLNRDGFPDIVTVSNFDLPAPIPMVPYVATPPFMPPFGSALDAAAFFVPTFSGPDAAGLFTWNGIQFPDGSVALQLNSGSNGNRWAEITLVGTSGVVSGASVNRDGIGAVVRFTSEQSHRSSSPRRAATAVLPVMGGSSYASQHSLSLTFGMGRSRFATVEVLWPGGVRNKLFKVGPNERLSFPEIPCSFADDSLSQRAYIGCVKNALAELVGANILSRREGARFFSSAVVAFAQRRSSRR